MQPYETHYNRYNRVFYYQTINLAFKQGIFDTMAEQANVPPSPPQYLPPGYYPLEQEDEINLMEIIRSIWKIRHVWAISLIITTMVFWGGWAAWKLYLPGQPVYSLAIKLTFSGIENGRYPDESPFQISDIIAPHVLEIAYQKNVISRYDITLDKFSTLFSIKSYSLESALIQEKYNQLTSDRKLRPEDVNALREKEHQEIKLSQLRTIRLIMSPGKSGLSGRIPLTVIPKILSDIPRIWAEKMIHEKGMLDLDTEILSSNLFRDKILNSLDYMLLFDYVDEKITTIQNLLITLRNAPNGLTAVDTESGMTIPELLRILGDVRIYQLNLLIPPIRDLGISKKKEATIHHYLNRLQQIGDQKNEFVKKGRMIREAHREYMALQNRPGSISNNAPEAMRLSSSSDTISPQLGDDFLSHMISLSDQASDIQFRQELIMQEQKYENAAIEIDFVGRMVQCNLTPLQTDAAYKESLHEFFAQQVKKSIPRIVTHLEDIVQASNRLSSQINVQNAGSVNRLYHLESGEVNPRSTFLGHLKKSAKIFIFVMVGMTVLVIPVALLKRFWRDEDNNDTGPALDKNLV